MADSSDRRTKLMAQAPHNMDIIDSVGSLEQPSAGQSYIPTPLRGSVSRNSQNSMLGGVHMRKTGSNRTLPSAKIPAVPHGLQRLQTHKLEPPRPPPGFSKRPVNSGRSSKQRQSSR